MLVFFHSHRTLCFSASLVILWELGLWLLWGRPPPSNESQVMICPSPLAFAGEGLDQPSFSTQWLFLAHFLGALIALWLNKVRPLMHKSYHVLQQPSSVQHRILRVFRLCTFVALGPLSPANPDYCGEILLGTILWEPAPRAVLLTPGIASQVSPNKVIRTFQ